MPPILILRARAWCVALLLVAAVVLLASCAASDPPPRNPLDDGGPGSTATGPLPTFPASGSVTVTAPLAGASVTPASDAGAETERITGQALALLAEWIGAPATEFRLTSIEAVEWPDACLGVANPGVACADVVSPGYRVTLHHVAAPNSPYLIHVSKAGNYAWAPSRGPVSRRVASVNPDAGMVTLEGLGASEDHMGTLQRLVPGSYLDVPLRDLQPGQLVSIGTADPLDGAEAGLIVFMVPIAE